MKSSLLALLVSFLLISNIFASHPKREMRAAWVATVSRIDWPKSGTTTQQQAELIDLLDRLKELGINAVVFQIRPESDALYDSPYEPWSFWLTGTQGRAPDPYYDPLEFAVAEAHKRGMEIHAWFNPYRAENSIGRYPISQNHVINQHPEWILTFAQVDKKYLDPGLQVVRDFVTGVIMDVVNRYDIDGVHFDDYFYPYPNSTAGFSGITTEDANTFATEPRGFNNIKDWRRDNVNLLVKMIYDSIQFVKSHVKFGISPFGIWKNGVPSGIIGLDAYSAIYCDALAWLNAATIDYLTPQLYWPFGGNQDYGKLLPWWASQLKGQHMYPGQGAYRIDNWPDPSEMPNMIKLNRETAGVYGSVFFSTSDGLLNNPRGFADSLTNNYYRYKALIPRMEWKDDIEPNKPTNLRYEPLAENGPYFLRWDLPAQAGDGDSASLYVVYNREMLPINMNDPANILDLTSRRYYSGEPIENSGETINFIVTALDRNHNESLTSNSVSISTPESPVLATPINGAIDQADTLTLSWLQSLYYSSYSLQVSSDDQFNNLLFDLDGIVDSIYVISDLSGLQNYYWRVKTVNLAGSSEFSDTFSFTTGFPLAASLASPVTGSVDVSLDTSLTWHKSTAATSYQVQLSRSVSFNSIYIDIDSTFNNEDDTSMTVTDLSSFTRYYWRVKAKNDLGSSSWSQTFAFRTIDVSSITDFDQLPLFSELYQNYPNPFNPVTTIRYSIANADYVRIIVYNLLGQEVWNLVDQIQPAGTYQVSFNASGLASGIYIYRMITSKFVKTKKMMLVR